MYSVKSYMLTKDEFNYLLPVLRKKLNRANGKHYFVGDSEDLDDMLNRLSGLYDYYHGIDSKIVYKCFAQGSLKPFRNFVR